MKIIDVLKKSNSGVSFEFFPPKSNKGKESLLTTIGVLKDYNPLYVSMTHGAGGLVDQDRTTEAVFMLLDFNKANFVVMPHLTCYNAAKESIKSLLDLYKNKGIENIMALRGDPPKDRGDISSLNSDFTYAADLVKVVKGYNHFCIGVAVYPEGHIENDTIEEDIEFTKQKIDMGADFAVTQMFFDNKYFFDFKEKMNNLHISIPVLPGILPLTNLAKVEEFSSICRATIPDNIRKALMKFSRSPKDQEKMGIELTIKQCQGLINNGAKQLHFFTLNRPKVMTQILDSLSF